MMVAERPYFLTNKKWYYFDEKEWCFKLTDQAPQKAKESYEKFYKELKKDE
jgi:hypothetical protein